MHWSMSTVSPAHNRLFPKSEFQRVPHFKLLKPNVQRLDSDAVDACMFVLTRWAGKCVGRLFMVFPAAKGQPQKPDQTLPKASLIAPAAIKPHLAPHS